MQQGIEPPDRIPGARLTDDRGLSCLGLGDEEINQV